VPTRGLIERYEIWRTKKRVLFLFESINYQIKVKIFVELFSHDEDAKPYAICWMQEDHGRVNEGWGLLQVITK